MLKMKTVEERKKFCPGCLFGALIFIFVFIILIFIVIFGIIPVVFKYSVGIQQAIILPTYLKRDKNKTTSSYGNESSKRVTPEANFTDFDKYQITGVKNFYINVDEKDNITLGVWHILPQELLSEFIRNDDYNYDGTLENQKYHILLYLHGNGGVRTVPIKLYSILRKYFQIIAVDYRGYGDSTPGILNEDNLVDDTVNVIKWLRKRSNARIFIWGHSLGTGIGTHSVANLKDSNYTVSGLILEAPFSSVVDVMERHPFLKIFSWLPWFKSTFINPIVDNGFGFELTKYIVNVDCPIMILHAKDDDIIPYELATKVYEVAINERNLPVQGNVTYHLFEAVGYNHMELFLAPELPNYTRIFIEQCLEFENTTKIQDD